MSTYNFSYYNGPIRNVKPHKTMGVHEAIDLIKSDKYKSDIEKLRSADNPSTKKTLKSFLPYFTFSGVFAKRLTENLKVHSGLIVLDFDNLSDERLAQLFSDFITIEFVCACWISPSGNGLKVLVKIDPDQHLQSFIELDDFFTGNFNLEIDQSGKDVARACFVSWDPNIFYNPESTIFEVQNPQTNESVKNVKDNVIIEPVIPPASNQFKINKDLQRVQHVVEQIEREKIDITDNDYDNRLTIGFALATLGEGAYNLYVRAIQFNDYDEDPRAKFNDAIQKGKFKTPAKFFSLAKDHGLSVKLPITLQEAQKTAEARQIIGDEENTNDFVKYGIYLKRSSNTYYSLDTKGIPREISNFKLKILYHINTGADEAYRLMHIQNIHGLERILRINTDDFVSAGSFKKVIARLGNFIFKGADSDLVKLQDMLQRHELHTDIVSTLGWNRKWKFYAFANGIYDTELKEFFPIDKYGIVERQQDEKKVNFFLPALSMVFADKDDQYVNEKKFIYIDSKVSYESWAKQYVKVFKANGKIGLVFWVCALFSDILFKAMGKRMPMPFSYGKRGSGKGTMTQSLIRLWGEKQDQIMLGGATTVVGFMRKMAQFSNALVWLDEYKNNLPVKVIESIKNLFDRIGYERGKKDNSFTTESTPILSAVWLSGQEMPTAEPALFTRCVLLSFSETKRTESEREAYRELVRMEDEGLSHLTVDMLKHRNLFENEFQNIYEKTLKEISEMINNNDVDERLLGNYSMLLATAKMMDNLGMIYFKMEDFQQQCIELILNQHFILRGSDDASKFWQVVEQLFSSMEIQEDREFMLKNGKIYLRLQDIYQQYVEAMHRRREVNVLDKSTLENYLASDPKSFMGKEKKSFGGKYTWCMVFKYREIGVDLIRMSGEVSQLSIKAKYQEMGVEYEEESNNDFNAGFPPADQQEMDFN